MVGLEWGEFSCGGCVSAPGPLRLLQLPPSPKNIIFEPIRNPPADNCQQVCLYKCVTVCAYVYISMWPCDNRATKQRNVFVWIEEWMDELG